MSLLQSVDHGNFAPLFLATLIVVCVAGTLVTFRWLKFRQVEAEACLKQAMVEHGMTANEIRQVLETPLSGAVASSRYGVAVRPEQV